MRFAAACDTHPGNRRPRNEDAVLSLSASGFWLVADGMGGHQAGDYASESIVQALAEVTLLPRLEDCVDVIEDRLMEVNEHLRNHAKTYCDGRTIGSTVVLTLVRDGVGIALWAGDSRLYRLRDAQLELITRDHNPMADLVESGQISEEEALGQDTHVITRAVGGQAELHLDVAVYDVEPGDTLLLCTDGLYREVEPERCVECLGGDVSTAVQSLMETCLDGEARDNVSVVVARAL